MLRLLADENVPGPVVRELRRRGQDVTWAREVARGSGDPAILELARRDERILVTFDKDFGELAFAAQLPAECGVILVRLSGPSPDADAARVVSVLESVRPWRGRFAVVTDDRIRLRPLPASTK